MCFFRCLSVSATIVRTIWGTSLGKTFAGFVTNDLAEALRLVRVVPPDSVGLRGERLWRLCLASLAAIKARNQQSTRDPPRFLPRYSR